MEIKCVGKHIIRNQMTAFLSRGVVPLRHLRHVPSRQCGDCG